MKTALEERLENLRQQGAEAPMQELAKQETALSFVNPTEFVELPSRGKYYGTNHPLHGKTSIEIKQMTTKEEDILTNKSFIKKGVVIDRLIESLVLDKSIKADLLLVGDKNAIMIAARISAYGPAYDVSITCLDCGNKSKHDIDLTQIVVADADELEKVASANPKFAHERLETGSVIIKLPKTGWAVECRLLSGRDETALLAFLERKKKSDPNAEIALGEQLAFIIVSINGVTDSGTVNEAIALMPAFDAKHLRTVYQKLIPNVKIEKNYTCGSCSSEQEVEVPFTQEFFWPK